MQGKRNNRGDNRSRSSRSSSNSGKYDELKTPKSASTSTSVSSPKAVVGSTAGACIGAYKDQNLVRAWCIAPPPTVSRVVVPRYVTSLVAGDDIVPRASQASLLELKKRCDKVLRAGWLGGAGVSVLSDMAGVASSSLSHYTGTQHDLHSLAIPGRVFYIKSRSHVMGASLQRVLRGNWREDVLWQIHSVVVSKKMLVHHSVEQYANILNRC